MNWTRWNLSLFLFSAVFLLAACATAATDPADVSLPESSSSGEEADPADAYPPVTGPDPSDRVAAFYYPWYGTPAFDGGWIHWDQSGYQPPGAIGSDYYPVLGAYSSVDPAVVAQHFAWLREAGVGVIISSWWGQGGREDRAVPTLLEIGERYGIQVAFHIEPYDGRTASTLLSDIIYLYDRYGDHPAFFRTTRSSRWSPDDRPKGLFVVWAISVPDNDSPPVEPDYWVETIDAVHNLEDGGLVIASIDDPAWVDGGHFDGLNNYASLSATGEGIFSWAGGLPQGAWYVPAVIPGFSARRVSYQLDLGVDRQEGATYDNQWREALAMGVEPALMTITSFNEWHEGTQIEPAQPQEEGSPYNDYGPLPPEGYLEATRRWVDIFLSSTFESAANARLRIRTASDWTTFGLQSGGRWIRPTLVSASEEATFAWMDGALFALNQPLADAEAGAVVEMVVDVELVDLAAGVPLAFVIERGGLGWTDVELMVFEEGEPVWVETLRWYSYSGGERNQRQFEMAPDPFLPGE
ncbi:MAG: hypothetical protein JXA97_04485 [Anaerolineales bacterium]|nr:hypothetical protein [Anaerolineales bacterium]